MNCENFVKRIDFDKSSIIKRGYKELVNDKIREKNILFIMIMKD